MTRRARRVFIIVDATQRVWQLYRRNFHAGLGWTEAVAVCRRLQLAVPRPAIGVAVFLARVRGHSRHFRHVTNLKKSLTIRKSGTKRVRPSQTPTIELPLERRFL